jgi:hypothetical protein
VPALDERRDYEEPDLPAAWMRRLGSPAVYIVFAILVFALLAINCNKRW